MKTEYKIVSATPEHAVELAPVMREPDVAELWAAAHQKPLEAIQASVEASKDPQTGLADGVVVCLFGVGTTTVVDIFRHDFKGVFPYSLCLDITRWPCKKQHDGRGCQRSRYRH